MKRKTFVSILGLLVTILAVLAFYTMALASFPDDIKEPVYAKQIKTAGVKSTFHKGVIYRYPNTVPMLEVTGDYYEMGLQYGVLLQPEIAKGIKGQKRILQWVAQDEGVPYHALVELAKSKARKMAANLPKSIRKR